MRTAVKSQVKMVDLPPAAAMASRVKRVASPARRRMVSVPSWVLTALIATSIGLLGLLLGLVWGIVSGVVR